MCVRVSGCTVVPWCTASSGTWKGAERLNPSSPGVSYPDNSTPPWWKLWGTAAPKPIPPPLRQGEGGEAEAGEGEGEEEEEEVAGEEGEEGEELRKLTTGLLSWWARKSLMMIDEEAEDKELIDMKHLLGAKWGRTFQCFIKRTQGMLQLFHKQRTTPVNVDH